MVKIIKRALTAQILARAKRNNKIIIIYGARQVGKTTLANELIEKLKLKTLKINADRREHHEVLGSRNFERLNSFVSGYQLLFIDEAQRIENIGLNLKILADGLPKLRIIVTGSSSFELSSQIQESLTGRAWTYNLFPFSQLELAEKNNDFELQSQLGNFLVYGSYPEVYLAENLKDKEKLLNEIVNSYLYKDVLELESIKKADKIFRLLKLLAFQIGQEVSINELSINLELNNETVRRYIDLLEKSFIIYRLSAFSGNLRKEVIKKDKIYFCDLGIRNVLINSFNSLENRNDVGALFENFLVMERIKKIKYQEVSASSYFWRAYTGSEIDYIEEREGEYSAFEFKYSRKNSRKPQKFLINHPDSSFEVVTKENYLKFIG